jgi:hypothetical protein
VLMPLANDASVCISPDGLFRGSPRVERKLV